MLTYSIAILLEPAKAQELRPVTALVAYARKIIYEFRFPAPSTHNVAWGGQDIISIVWVTESDGKVLYGNLVGGLHRADTSPERRRQMSVISIEKGPYWGVQTAVTKPLATKSSAYPKPLPSSSSSTTTTISILRYSILIEVTPERADTLGHHEPPMPWVQAVLSNFKFPPTRSKNVQWESELTILCAWETESNGKILYDNIVTSIERCHAWASERETYGIVEISPGPDWGIRFNREVQPLESVPLQGGYGAGATATDADYRSRDERHLDKRHDDASYYGGEAPYRSSYGPRGEPYRDEEEASFYQRASHSTRDYERPRSPPLSYERPAPPPSDPALSHRPASTIHPSRLPLISPSTDHHYPNTSPRGVYPPLAHDSHPSADGYREPSRSYPSELQYASHTPQPSFAAPSVRAHSPDADMRRRIQSLSDQLAEVEAARRRYELQLQDARQQDARVKRDVENRVAEARRTLLGERDDAMNEVTRLKAELSELKEARARDVAELEKRVTEVEMERDEVKKVLDALTTGGGQKEKNAGGKGMDAEDEGDNEGGPKALKELAVKLQHELLSQHTLREATEQQLRAELTSLKEELSSAQRSAEDEVARCREAERRARAAVRRADVAEREKRVAEKERADMERELKGRGVLPAVLEAMRQISRMAVEVDMGEGDGI